MPISADIYMVTWDSFYNYVMPSVQGCPVQMVENAVRSAVIEFCEKTLLWKQESELNDIIADVALYTFGTAPDAKVVMATRLSIQDAYVEPIDLATLETFSPLWRTLHQPLPKHWCHMFDDTIRLIGIPTEDIDNALQATVALKPARSAAACPSFLFHDWADEIACGALAKLHAMRNKVWAVPELVVVFDRKFREGISRARSKSDKSRLRESKNMLPVSFITQKGYF